MNINTNYSKFSINFGQNHNYLLARLNKLKEDTFVPSLRSKKTIDERLNETIANLAKLSHCNEEIFTKSLNEIVRKGTENNPKLLEKRTKFLEESGDKYTFYLNHIIVKHLTNQGQPELILDNIPEIDNIVPDWDEDKECKYARGDLLDNINPKSLKKLQELKDINSLTSKQKMAIIMHSANEHNIEFGDEEVEVDSSEIISLLTGLNSLSTVESGTYDKFNSTVKSLTEKSHRNEDLTYSKITEGILTQRPDLVQICKMYEALNKNITPDSYLERGKNFFEMLDKTGKLEHKIKLKTIVPDENALLTPSLTLLAFELKDY